MRWPFSAPPRRAALGGTAAHSSTANLAQAVAATPSLTGCKSSKGKITYGIAGAGITALDPNTISFAGQAPLQTLLYDGLTKYNKAMQPVPDLATSWKSSKDLMHWSFKLRNDVRYANGRQLTSADARANMLRVLDPAVASQAQGNMADFRSVHAVGKFGLTIRLGHPSALLPAGLVDVKMSDTTGPASSTRPGTAPVRTRLRTSSRTSR